MKRVTIIAVESTEYGWNIVLECGHSEFVQVLGLEQVPGFEWYECPFCENNE